MPIALASEREQSYFCLSFDGDHYEVVLKQPKDYKSRSPIVSLPSSVGLVRKESRIVVFNRDLPFADFGAHPKEPPPTVLQKAGGCQMQRLLADCPFGDMAVIPGTTFGLATEGLRTILARQGKRERMAYVRELILQELSAHFGFPLEMLVDCFQLPDVDGLGATIGVGPYHAWRFQAGRKPLLIRPGMRIDQILDQVR